MFNIQAQFKFTSKSSEIWYRHKPLVHTGGYMDPLGVYDINTQV